MQLLQIIPHFLDSTFEGGNFCATPSLVNINFRMGYVVMNAYHIPCWLTFGEDIQLSSPAEADFIH